MVPQRTLSKCIVKLLLLCRNVTKKFDARAHSGNIFHLRGFESHLMAGLEFLIVNESFDLSHDFGKAFCLVIRKVCGEDTLPTFTTSNSKIHRIREIEVYTIKARR